MTVSQQWRLRRFPEGLPTPADWELSQTTLAEPGPGQVVLEALYLDVAPYMRGRISAQKNYAAGVGLGDVMVGGGIGRVLQSRSELFQVGNLVVSDFGFGWQTHACLPAADLRRVEGDAEAAPASLDLLGLNGVTAYFGLFEAGSMRPGDTVVVSAAAGSVGQYVGQLAKLAGGRSIAIASSSAKLDWCKSIGFDDGLAYRETDDLKAALQAVCPNGVDVFFDSTGGPIHDAVMQNLAVNARITICGMVSLAGNFDAPDMGQRFLRQTLVARARIQGFLATDYAPDYALARCKLKAWSEANKITSRFDFVDGFANQPAAFCGLFQGENFGKRLVRLV